MTDRVGAFIREQPAALAATVRTAHETMAAWEPPDTTAVVLVGSGSSFNALTAAEPAIADAARAPVHVRGPLRFLADLAAGRLRPSFVVVLSQSGASVTSIEAAEAALDRGLRLLRITATLDSAFGRLGGDLLPMPIGPEPIGPKTKGYTASVAALLALAARLRGSSDGGEPSLSSSAVEDCRAAAEALVRRAPDPDFVLVAGQGPHLGTAFEASLKIAEMSGLPAAGLEMEEVLHGRLHGLTRRSLALFVAGAEGELATAWRAAETMRGLGVTARVVGPDISREAFAERPGGEGARSLDPILGIVPFQWLAWRLAWSRGLDPAEMRYPGLSQRLAIKTEGSRA